VKWACLAVSWDGGVHAGGRQGLEVFGLRGNGACSAVRVGMVDNDAGAAFLAVLVAFCEAWLVERGREAWATSQTRLARLVLPLACCPHWGDMGALGLFTIDDIGKLTVGLVIS
jgi:hypothetical protein